MPNKIIYTITTSDGKSHQVDEQNINKYGMQSYADAYKGATIRMRDKDGADYDIPLNRFTQARGQGLRPFRFEHRGTAANTQTGSHAQQVADEYDESVRRTQPRMTAAQKAKMSNWASSFGQNVGQATRQATQALKRQNDARKDNALRVRRENVGVDAAPYKLGENPNVVETGSTYNPQSGKVEKTYLTEAGNEYVGRDVADLEQNIIDDQKAREMEPVNTALRDAYAERDRLDEAMRQRMQEIDDGNKGVGSILRELAEGSKQPGSFNPLQQYQTDEQYRQLEAAARKNRATIQTLEDKRDNKMNDFFHSIATTAANGYTFNDGLAEINDAIALLDARKHINSINRKQTTGEPLTEEEQAAASVLAADAVNAEVQGQYAGDYGAWARAGQMVPTSIDLMKDIMLTPGAGGVAKGVAGKVAGIGTRFLAKQAGETAAKSAAKAIGRGVLKGTGILLGAHTAGAVVSNTAGINRTAGLYGSNVAGQTVKDAQGNYKVQDSMDILDAFVDAERNQIRETGSEMFGEFLPGAGGLIKKGLEKIGLSKISNALTNVGNKQWYQQYNRLLTAGGYNGIPGEALEEYEGMAFDALTGNADETWQQLKDPRTHVDIWLGTAAMSALLGAAPVTIQGAHTAMYYRYKHATDKADRTAAYRFGDNEKWNGLKDVIDNTPNEDMANAVMDIMNDSSLYPEQKTAALNYVRNLTKMRGYNIGQMSNANEESEESKAANESYANGYNTENPEELNQIKNRYEVAREKALQAFPQETLDEIENDNSLLVQYVEAPTLRKIVVDYLNTKQAYDGMIQRVRDDIDTQVQQSNDMIDSRINKTTGMIQPAMMKAPDENGNERRAYVVSGNVEMLADMSGVDREKSDGSILVRYADTGEMEMVSPSAIMRVDDAISPEQEQQEAETNITQTYAQQKANEIDGKVAFAQGDVYTLTDEAGKVAQVTVVTNKDGIVDNGDGTVNVDAGTGEVVAMPKDAIQIMIDRTNKNKVVPQEEPAAAVTYNLNDDVYVQDENGNIVHGVITGDVNEDGQYEVQTDTPVKNVLVNLYTPDQFVQQTQATTTEQPAAEQASAEQATEQQPTNEQQVEQTQAATAQEEQKSAIPTDEKGNMLYHQVPVETTINDLYDGKLDDNEIRDFVDANISEADKNLEKINKKAPKIGTNKAEYLKKKQEWQKQVEDATRIRDYWNSVKNYIAQQTHTTPEEVKAAQDELSGEAARREYQDMGGSVQQDAVSVASDFIRGAKITPESFKAETGYGTDEQRKFVGMIAKAEKGGKTIDRLAEELVSYDNAEMNGVLFGGDTSSAKDAILSALQGAGTRGELKQTNEAEEQAYIDARNAARDAQYMEQYGMTYEEYLAYEEQIMPTIWREYNNYDETAFNNMYAEEIEQFIKSRENDTTGEEQADDRGNQVLSEQQVTEQRGSAGSTEPGTEVQAGVQGIDENAVASEEAQQQEVAHKIATAEAETNTNPTEGQKEAGNYKKGHVRIDGYDITIEQPKGSVRRGTDADGKQWEQTMNNTYGYIRGTEGVDGDHIDIFLSDNPTEGNVYVVDQVNPDGSFDEHKVMYGFNSADEARAAYLSNYEEGWQGLGTITEVSKDEFKKWVNSSRRKTKPFSEYKSVNAIGAQNEDNTSQIQGLQGYSRDKIKNIVKDYVGQKLSDADAKIKGVEIHGSRNRGDAREDSDLDVVIEYEGDIREDDMFNLLNDDEDALYIEGIRVDINPIREQETGTLDKYMDRSREYDEEKKNKEYLESISNKEKRAIAEGRTEYYIPVYDGWGGQRDGRFDKVWLLPEDVDKDGSDLTYRNLDLWSKEDAYHTEEGFSGVRKFFYNKEELNKAYFGKDETEDKKVEKVSPEILSFRQKKIDELNAVKDEDVKKGPSAWYFDKPLLVSAKTKKSAISKMHKRREDDIQSINNGSIDWMYNAIQDNGLAGYEEVSSVEEKPAEEKKPEYGANNKVVSKERYEELKKRMIKKLGQLNFGMDPELIEIGVEMTAYHLEAGARKFADYVKAMINDVGDVIRPYLKSLYNAARDYPDVVEAGLNVGMSTGDEVSKFDVTNFDKKTIDALATADNVVKEQNIKKETEKIIKENEKKSEQTAKKSVSSQKIADLFGDINGSTKSDAQRRFSDAVKSDMLSALDRGEKPYRSIVDLRKRASEAGMDVDNEGRSDILLQELVEDGLVGAAREVINKYGSDSKDSYDLICKLYDMQPTIAARSSNRIKMQQYSTPLPMAWNAAHFAMSGKQGGKVLEPTAGNGMLVFAVPVNQVHANELDETRLNNLREQGFAEVTQQDATEPFEGGKQYDAIIANPPFGSRKAVDYDGKMIPGLDPQITLNALSSMKDDGKAAIIIGGNMEYAKNGSIKSMKPFFTYLYDHYNVKGIVDMDGKLYAKQGTTFPTRMILIDGRRSEEERAQTTVYPPVESKAVAKANSFEELYNTVNDIINSKEKTNGTEILHSRERELLSVNNRPSGNAEGNRRPEQPRKNDTTGRGNKPEGSKEQSERVLPGERGKNTGAGETRNEVAGSEQRGSRGNNEPAIQRVGGERVLTERVGLKEEPKKRSLTEEKLPYRPHNTAFSLNSVAPSAMVEAMDKILTQIEKENGSIDEFVRKELGYDTIEEAHQALAAEQMDSVAMAIYQMKKGQALIIGDQTGVGKGRQMAALIRWAVKRGEKPIFITQKADLFSDIYRDLVDVGSGDLVPFIFNSDGAMVDSNGNVVHKPLSASAMSKVFASGELPDSYDFAVLTYSQVNTGDAISQKEAEEAAKKSGTRAKKSKASKEGKPTPKATFLRAIAKDNYLFLDESHTAAGSSNTGAYLQSILKSAKAATFASATFAKRPDTMPLYAIRTAMSQAKIEPEKLISIIEKGGVTLQEIMSRELTNAGQMVRRERDMSDVKTDWKTIDDPSTVKRARENYDKTIQAFNAIIKFQNDFVKPKIDDLDQSLAIVAQSAGIKRGTDKMGVENVPFASKTYNYTKQLMLALKVDAIADEVEKEIKAGRHPVIALESTMESTIKDYSAGEVIKEPTFSASLLKGLDSVMQYTIKDEDGKETYARYAPSDLGKAGEEAYYNLQKLIRESTSDIFISPLDAIIERLHEKGYKVGELTGRNLYVERNENGEVVVKRRTDKDKKKMQRDFNSGNLDVLILNKSASTGISLHASEKFKDQRQRTMIIAQPLSDINDYMQMIGRIDRTGQVHRGYYINLGLPVPAENRFLMMLSTKLKSLNANTTTSQDSKSNEVEAPDLLNKYGSQVVVEYLRDNPEVYEKMGAPLKKGGLGSGKVQASELDEYKPQDDDARKITGYVALLSTKEQEDFYNDVVKRYNDLIQYLNDTGSNDLKINVMPLRAKTLEKRVSSEGIDPNGTNPFAKNAYVEKVEMDVLRKPMKAEEVRKTIDKLNKTSVDVTTDVIRKESDAKIASENARYENAREKALDDIQKQKEKIEKSKKLSDEEKVAAINSYITDTNNTIEERHDKNLKKITDNRDQLIRRLRMFDAGKSYLVPDNLESMTFDFASPAIFCGYKAKENKITASTTLAVFATLDSRRRIEIKLSDINALQSIDKMTMDNIDAARAITLDNWDSQIPTETRKEGYILTGNILQAIADSQDEYGGYTGHLVSYTDIDGNIHDGILMPDKWNTSLLKSSGAPLSARMEQIKRYEPIVSSDGKVTLNGSQWAEMYYLTVPKTKKDGAIYYENKVLLDASKGEFYPYRGNLRADIPAENIEGVVKELTKLGVKVRESNEVVSRDTNINEEEANDLYREVTDERLINKLENEPKVKVYRAMQLQDGKLLPPMSGKIKTIVKDKNGKERTKWVWREPTNIGKWEEAEERPDLANDDGTFTLNKGNNSLNAAYNPYIHTSRSPINDQFSSAWNRDELVTVEVEVPVSELTSGYRAEKAKDSVGEVEWKSGPVGRQLAKIGKPRLVILSRWDKPIRVIPVDEVAGEYAKRLEGTGIEVPFNTVTPELREALVKAGVKIGAPENNNAGKASLDAYNEWRNNNEIDRQGTGALTDSELSNANDPAGKMLGKPSRTPAQQKAFAERERQRMANRAREVADILHLDNVEIVTDASTLQGRRAKAKGFYSRDNGKIVIVVPNHVDMADIEQTVLHEAVAHYGLRKLFGSNFDTFINNVYNNADENVRREIVQLAAKHNWDFATATEEYLASLAENTNFEDMNASWWNKIKDLFLSMVRSIGLKGFSGKTLSDNELRYILWRSYENLKNPGRYRNVFSEAEDIAKQNELKVGNYAVRETRESVADNDLYREVEPEERRRVYVADIYDARIKNGMYQMREAVQDSMLSLREAMTEILKAEGNKNVKIEDIAGFENAYLGENRLSSVNKAEADAFANLLFKPLLEEAANLSGSEKGGRDELVNYMMAKHGLERNKVMAERDAKNEYDNYVKEHPKGEKTLDDFIEKYRKRDYAGLTALTGKEKVAEAEAEAQQMVDDYEAEHDTEELWNRTRAVSNAILDKEYDTGLMSKDTMEKLKSMFDYYIPLRGFDEKTSEDEYAYLENNNSAFFAPIKAAKGRKSKADNPFAYLQGMAENAIMQGNRNKLVKQKFLNFVLNHQSDLASVSDLWLKYNEVNDEWEPVFPDNIKDTDTAKEVEKKMQEFEERMQQLAEEEPELYKHGKQTVEVPYRVVESKDLKQHQILVRRNGRNYVITINGNPRAAQAVNGLTNPDNDMSGAIGAILKAGQNLNRQLSAFYTTRNPDFVVSNFIRDALYANSMAWVKERPNYALRFHKNYVLANPIKMKKLFARYRKNKLKANSKTDMMFKQFMLNGGETGYASVRDIEKRKNEISKEIKKYQGKLPIKKAWGYLAERFDELNRAVENSARFAAFVTSREMGRSIERSIYDAKEISVNFNKKGSGSKFMGATGQTKLGNAGAFISGLGRSGFVFWNAAIQGSTNFGRQVKHNPAKALTAMATMFMLGAVVASLGYGDDDDDDKNSYWNLPDYVRRSNIMFRAGDQWVSIPLPVEYRSLYGLGELMISTMSDKEHLSGDEIANQIAGQISQVMPIDFLEGEGGAKAFIPSFIKPFAEAYGYNRSWTGMPIYKDTDFNKDLPEWTKAYKSANKYLVDLSETLNEATGGDKYTKGEIDINPAKIEHVLTGYFGGIANTIDRLTKMGETAIGQREYDPNSILIWNRIVKNGDERTEYKAINNEYFRIKKEHDTLKKRLNNYERDTDNGVFDYAEKIDFLYNSPEYRRLEIYEEYQPDIEDLIIMLDETNDADEQRDIEAQINELKKMMISDINKYARK